MPISYAIGISPPNYKVDFKPELNTSFPYVISNNRDSKIEVEVVIKGDLSDYLSPSEKSFILYAGGSKTSVINLDLPQKLDPGNYTSTIQYIDSTKVGEGMFQARTAVIAYITVIVPIPGRYAKVNLEVPNINEGETIAYFAEIENIAEEDIENAVLSMKIIDSNGKYIREFSHRDISVDSLKKTVVNDFFESHDFIPGEYTAFAELDFGGKEMSSDEVTFNIGSYDVDFVGHSDTLYAGEISPFRSVVKSKWNSPIKDVSVDVTINGKEHRSLEKTLKPFEETEFLIYVDEKSLEPGDIVDAIVTVHFGDSKKSESLKLDVVENPEKQLETDNSDDEDKIDLAYIMTLPTTYLMIAVMILVLVNIYVIINKNKKKR
ncbi:MAG: hypothetical protein ACLFUO_05635 [Candidatus Woesearchaeota archaeon]